MDRREINEREEMQEDMPTLSRTKSKTMARGREGRIMKKMSKMKPGQARRRLRKGMRSMMMGFPDKPNSISAFSRDDEITQPVTDVLPPLPPPPPVDFDDPNLPLTDEEDRRRLKQGMDRLPFGGEAPRMKDDMIPIQITGKDQGGIPMTALPKTTPYYGSTTPQPTKAPTKQPTRAPSYSNPLEQFKGAFGRREGRDVEAEMRRRGELRQRKR